MAKRMKVIVDMVMFVLFILLMSFEMPGRQTHEWLGICIFGFFIIHVALNKRWGRAVGKGRYSSFRMFQTAIIFLLAAVMLGSLLSGILLSESVFSFLNIKADYELAQPLHMLSAYWGLVLMSLHIGTNWTLFLNRWKQRWNNQKDKREWIFRIVGAAIAGYGAVAFHKRRIAEYLFMKSHFVMFDPTETLFTFLLDYVFIIGLFVWIGHYSSQLFKWIDRGKRNGEQRERKENP